MEQKPRRQSLSTALRHLRRVIRSAEKTDFTTRLEDTALRTMYGAVRKMYGFLQDMARDSSICDCEDRSWYGEGHDTQCNVSMILNLLSELGQLNASDYYVLFIDGDIEPFLHGPFKTEEERDATARRLRAEDGEKTSGIYRLNCTPLPRIDAYSASFFEE